MYTPYSLYSSLYMDGQLAQFHILEECCPCGMAWHDVLFNRKIVTCFLNVLKAACEIEIILCLRIKQVYVKSLPKFPVLGQIGSVKQGKLVNS